MNARAAPYIGGILLGCGVNVVFLELLTKRDPECGGLITLAQFAFVALAGLPGAVDLRSGLRPRKIPLWFHAALTALFFGVSFLNNLALSYNISMPTHMVFRSSSLAASLFLGAGVLGKRYHAHQQRGVLLVTAGIVTVTLADARAKASAGCCGDATSASASTSSTTTQEGKEELEVWLVGIAMLLVALFGSAALGHAQEWAYAKYGKASSELKFYSHALALPYFGLLAGDGIAARVAAWNASEARLGGVPELWLLLAGNVLSQLFCISCVYSLTAVSSTLTCTMTITVRKFLSIIFSVVYFANPFSGMHWAGMVLVFAGVADYSGLLRPEQQQQQQQQQQDSKKDR